MEYELSFKMQPVFPDVLKEMLFNLNITLAGNNLYLGNG